MPSRVQREQHHRSRSLIGGKPKKERKKRRNGFLPVSRRRRCRRPCHPPRRAGCGGRGTYRRAVGQLLPRGRVQEDRPTLRPLHRDALRRPVRQVVGHGGARQGGRPGGAEERVGDGHLPLQHLRRRQHREEDGAAAAVPRGLLREVRGGGGAADGRDGGAGHGGVRGGDGAGGGGAGGGEDVPEGVQGRAAAPEHPHLAQPRGRPALQHRLHHHQADPRVTER
uniref:Uncharacterized protein n=1 Tax=Oryza rufipogon TaxID=4529 RepID=A0A0E0MVD6_ORYRU